MSLARKLASATVLGLSGAILWSLAALAQGAGTNTTNGFNIGGPIGNSPVNGDCIFVNGTVIGQQACSAGGGGTVTSVSVVTANGVSGSVATATTTPAITVTLGAITPTSVSTGLGTAVAPVIANTVSPTSGFYWLVTTGQGIGFAQAGVSKWDWNVTSGGVFTVAGAAAVTGTLTSANLGLGGAGNITFATRSIITSNAADGGFKVSNNAGTQSWTAATSATAGQVVFGAGIAGTLATATGANVVCNAGTAGSPLTLQVFATGCAASSARFKEGIASINRDDALSTVLAMRPVFYRYRPEFNMGSDEHIGFTAEQLSAVPSPAPGYSMITTEEDGATPHAVKYNEMAPLFAAAIQQLKSDVDELRKGVAEAKASKGTQ